MEQCYLLIIVQQHAWWVKSQTVQKQQRQQSLYCRGAI